MSFANLQILLTLGFFSDVLKNFSINFVKFNNICLKQMKEKKYATQYEF